MIEKQCGDGYGYVYRWVDGEQVKLPASMLEEKKMIEPKVVVGAGGFVDLSGAEIHGKVVIKEGGLVALDDATTAESWHFKNEEKENQHGK